MGYLIAIIIFVVVLVALRAIAWGKSGPTRAGWIAMILAVLGLIASFVILANQQRGGPQQVTNPATVEGQAEGQQGNGGGAGEAPETAEAGEQEAGEQAGGGGGAVTESTAPEGAAEGTTAEEEVSQVGTLPGGGGGAVTESTAPEGAAEGTTAEEEVSQAGTLPGGGGGAVTETTATTEAEGEAAASTEAGTSQPGGGETGQAGGVEAEGGAATASEAGEPAEGMQGEEAATGEGSATQPPTTEAGRSGGAEVGPAAEQAGTSRSPTAASLSTRLDRHFRTDPMAKAMIAMIITGDTNYCDEYMKGVGAKSCTFDAQERSRIYQEKVGELGPYNALLASIDWDMTYMVRCFGRDDTLAYIEEMQAKSN